MAGDEIGLFDANGIIDSNGNTGEVLVGAGIWNGEQLNLTAITSIDLSAFGGPILPGAVPNNPLTLKVWIESEDQEYNDITFDVGSGTGTFNGLFTSISEIYTCEIADGALSLIHISEPTRPY